MNKRNRFGGLLLVAALAATAGCDGFLDVSNPGPILDDNLNSAEAMEGLVVGMSSDVSEALADLVYATSIMADELAHGGSYTQEGLWYRGVINPEDINGYWSDAHRMRWVAENGIDRMKTVLGAGYDKSPLSARANLFAGLANRTDGELLCEAVIDGGPAQDFKIHFERAEKHFTEAIRLASANNQTNFRLAATAGRAAVRAWLGNWAAAIQDAALVPDNFRFDAVYSTNSGREENEIVTESNTSLGRRELTVFNTIWVNLSPGGSDPRVPWSIPTDKGGKPLKGQDGKTTFYQQLKHASLSAPIALAKGTEMRLLQAEEALRRGDIATAYGFMNKARAQHKLAALTPAATLPVAWKTLHNERGADLWLEARRFWDLRRWNSLGQSHPGYHSFLASRDKCIPISANEREANPNLTGG